jgi:hypothetical protein
LGRPIWESESRLLMAGGFAVCIKTGAIMRELFDAELDIVGGAKGDANNSTVRKTAEPIKLVVELIVDILKILEPKQVQAALKDNMR